MPEKEAEGKDLKKLTEDEWRMKLPRQRFLVLRKKGTEPPFTGELLHNTKNGMYVCAGCGAELFSSDAKYDSGSGWPSFWKAVGDGAIEMEEDRSLFMVRTEIKCGRCGGHLGHVFNDGPQPTGKRFCVNSASLDFRDE